MPEGNHSIPVLSLPPMDFPGLCRVHSQIQWTSSNMHEVGRPVPAPPRVLPPGGVLTECANTSLVFLKVGRKQLVTQMLHSFASSPALHTTTAMWSIPDLSGL
jgi:hypothetical protein